jgi:hypothetical protein
MRKHDAWQGLRTKETARAAGGAAARDQARGDVTKFLVIKSSTADAGREAEVPPEGFAPTGTSPKV